MNLPLSVIAAAQAAYKKYFPIGPFASVTLAQFILESDWGRHAAGRNNYFGIKATAEQIAAGQYTNIWTHEVRPSGQAYKVQQKFANYPTLEAGFEAHAELLTSAHYKLAKTAQTPEEYCTALQTCGYATDPKYAEKLGFLIAKHDLKQYDKRSLT